MFILLMNMSDWRVNRLYQKRGAVRFGVGENFVVVGVIVCQEDDIECIGVLR
jgi:hypothetical protein